jgi:VCBS repeat-containing protein
MPNTQPLNVTPSIFFTAVENEFGNIDLFGSAVGMANGTTVNFLFTDAFGNSKTTTVVVVAGEFSLTNVWMGMFGAGPLDILASAAGVSAVGSLELSGNQIQAPVTLTEYVLDENTMIDVQGVAPALDPGTVLTLVIRDEQNNEVMATAEVLADGSFSVQDIDTLGLSEGVLRFDVVAQDANGVLNLTNIASLVLAGNGPQGADNTLSATEDSAYVVNAAAFGYNSTQGYTLTGVKITSLPAQGTLKLNGVAVQVDTVISKADLDAGKLTYQGALNGNGSNYTSFQFKVQDSRTSNNEDTTPNKLTFNVAAVNDAAVISGTSTGAVTEAGGVANAIVGNPNATGTLTSTDVDGTANAFTAVSTATTSTGGYGSYTMTAAGVWAYTLNNGNTTVQALKAAQTLTDTFTVTAADGTPRVITITITGTNDAAIISGTSTGAVTEAGGVANATAGNPNATGTLTSTDLDGVANAFTAVTTAAASTGGYGTYTMTAAGVWAYTLNNANTTVQALAAAATLTDTFTVTAADGTARVVTVTITGSNDAAIISGATTGAINEGVATTTGTVTSTDVDGTANVFTAAAAGTASTSGYGTYALTSAGVWTYTLNNANTTVNALAAGETLTDTFTVKAADGTSQVVTVTITGTNDAAIISGPVTGAVTEAGGVANAIVGNPNATGTLTSTDVDGTANAFTAVSTATASTSGYGTYTMTAAGVWAYTLNNANTTVQALAAAATLTDTFTVTAADGTARVVTVTITGSNDAAIISGTSIGAVTEAGGVANAIVGNPNATGTLTSTDVDGPANAFTAVSTATTSTGGYGSYTMTAAGVWTYTLNNGNATVQALTAAATLTDTFTVTAADGTAKVVTVTITGANDAPLVAVAIPDQTAVIGTAFSYTLPTGNFIDVDSTLTYTATRGDGTALPTWLTFNAATRTFSGTPTDTIDFNIKVTASDGTASISDTFALGIAPVANSVAITSTTGIQNNFLNAGDTISATVNFTELVNVTGTPQITLNIGGTLVKANYVSGSGTSALTFSYTILAGQTDANGIGINANSLGLNGGTITDAVGNNATQNFAAITDNISYKVDTTAATAVADVKDSDEDTTPITGSVATNDTNKDGTESYAIVGSAAGTYGTLTMNANGTYSYARSVVLDQIQTTAVETFTYKVTDAAGNTTQSTLTINMAPVNDAAVVGGDLVKTVSETNAALTVTGALTITDVDSAQTFNALSGVVGTYGSFSMTTAGAWTYVMSSAQDQFKAGTAYNDVFTVTTADNTTKTVTVTINGTNDAPVVAAAIPDQTANPGEAFSYTLPAGTFSDPDNTLTYTATRGDGTALPNWLTFDPATLTFSGIPTSAIDINLKVIASDGTNSVSDVFRVFIAPAVTSLAVVSATGVVSTRLNAGDVATIEINFIEAVTVTGTPQLALNIGGTLVQANYVSGSGGTTLTFKYTVQAGQNDANGISIDANALTLNGGTIKDVHGNNAILDTPAVTDNASFKVDTTAPVVGTLTLTDTGTSPTDGISQSGTVTVGALEVGATWEYSIDNGSTWLAGSGTSFTLAAGTYAAGSVQMRETDLAGNVQTGALIAKNAADITVDQTAPLLVGSNPSDNGYLTAVGNNLVLSFNEAVAKGTGLIQLFKADGTLVQSFDAATSTALTWSGNNLSINPTADLLASTGYYIKVAATAVKDVAGNAYAGIADATTLNFTTADASGAIVVPVNGIMAIEDLSTIGDFNGDGYDDFIVGAGMNGLSSTGGAAFVVYGNANGTVPNLSAGSIAASAGFKIVSGQTGDYFGIAVNSAGDTNGDGLADLVVSAKYGDASYRESAYVVFGKSNASTVFATGLNLGTGFTANMGYQIKIDESYWGHAVSNAGDVNGDGLSDLLVTSDFSASRNVYVIYGKTGNQSVTLTSYTQFTPDLGYNVLSGNVTDLGQSVYGAGDVNGDGLADFIVSAPNNSTGQRGMVYVVYGNSTGTSVQLNATNGIAASQGFRILGDTGNNSSYSRFGFAVSSAGDVNGDGLADVMISSPYQPGVVGGAVYVVYGNSSGTVLDMDLRTSAGLVAASRGFRISSSLAGDHLGPYGKDIASAGDINGDGLSDMIISGRDDYGSTTASTYVVYGNASGTNVAIDASGNIAASNGFKLKGAVGFAVASAGDINGDGLNDLLVSARLGSSDSYNVVLGGTQWVTAALDGAGTFAGTSGSEALIGSTGNDTITGGGGVDRFFAGKGDDTIVLTASDIANLQNNSTGQTAKTTVSGGTGFDTIRLSGGANLDLLKVGNAAAMGIDETSRIEGIERIDMATDTAANVLNISNKDVNDMAGFNKIHTGSASADGKTWTNVSGSALSNITSYHQMVVDGGSNDTVALTANGGAWANVGTVNNSSANYTVYQNNVTHSQVLVQQGVTVDTQAPTLLWSTPADNDYVNTANLGNNITLQFSENVVKGNGFIQLWNKTTGQPVQAFDVSSSTLVTGWGTSTLTINPTANLAAATDYFIKISDNAIQDNTGLAYSGLNSDLQLNFSTQSANSSYAVPSSFTSASSTSSYLRSVATAGDFNGDGYDDLLVGVAGSNQSGVYVIYGNALGEGLNLDKDPVMSNGVIAADQGFKIHGTNYFGTSVSGIGDINGDGYADVLISAPSDSQGGTNAGAAFVVYGSADPAALNLSSGTIAAARGFKIVAGNGYGSMGDSVAGVGDMNGDGISDFVIGYAGANAGAGNGAAYVVYGKTNATSLTLGTDGSIAAANGIRLTGGVNENAGFSVSGAGDVNGDGLADVIVSANGALSNGDGAAYVIFGGATGGDMNALVTAGKGFKVTGLTNSTGYHLGTSVSSAGDVNGDGYADLIVATDTDQSYTAAYVVYGGAATTNVSLAASTIAAAKGFRILGSTANGAGLGQVSGAGDLNGDGFADVIVGSSNGSSYVVYGKATGAEVSVSTGTIAASQGFKLTYSTNITSTTAQAVSFAGDFDGDGLNDLVIAEDTDFGNSQTYKIVFGGTQWLTTPVIGNGNVTGTTASEAILGSTANDTLTGGGGVDRFFAGVGDDTIVLTGTDATNLADVAAGQTAKSSVNGGAGFDTIRLSDGANLNLTTISNAGGMGLEENSRIESIERIVMGADAAANTLTLTARDVKDMAGFNMIYTGTASADGNIWTNVTGTALSAITKYHQLVVYGDTNDTVVFAPDTGYWANVGTVSNGATSFIAYQNDANLTQVLVKANTLVTNNDPNLAPVFSSTSATAAAGLLPVVGGTPIWNRTTSYDISSLGGITTNITATGDSTPTNSYGTGSSAFMWIGDQQRTETLSVSFDKPVYQVKIEFSALNNDGTNKDTLSFQVNGANLVLSSANLSPTGASVSGNTITGNGGGVYSITSSTAINSLSATDTISGGPSGVGIAIQYSSAPLQVSGGVAISSLMPAATDADGSVVGYAITSAATETGADTTPGKWEYFNGSTWTSLSGASVAQAVYLTASTKVRWNDNDGGYTALSAVAVDNTVVATLGQALNVMTRGGATAYSSGIATLPAASFSNSALSLALASDTGANASDFITSNGTMNVNLSLSSNTWSYSTDSGTTWTTGSGTNFVLGAGSYATNAVQVRENGSGFQTVAKFANALTVDTAAPTVAVTMSDAALTLGEKSTVTFQFSENVANFDINDVAIQNSAGGAGAGGLSALTKVSDSKWTAVYTPVTETNTTGNQIVVALNGYNDAAGNNGSTGQSTFTVDTRFSSSLTAGFYGTTSSSSSSNSSVTTNAVIVNYWNPAWQGDTMRTYKNGSQIDVFTISGATNSKSLGNLTASPGDTFYSTITHNGIAYNLFNMIKVNPGTAGLTRYDSPLVLDLNGDGVQTVDISHGAMFDLQATGVAQATGWVDAHDGLLAMDLNNDGKINSGAELFGNSTLLADGQKATTGWTALAQHDSNVDGKMDAQDAVFDALMVWQDANGNGLTDTGELRSLKEVGVISINLSHDSTITHQNGNLLQGVSSYKSSDGQTHEVADAWFQTLTEGVKTPQNVESIVLQDVLTGTTSSSLPMTVNPANTLQLDAGAWTSSGRLENENGQIYAHFNHDMAHLFVDQSMTPSIL